MCQTFLESGTYCLNGTFVVNRKKNLAIHSETSEELQWLDRNAMNKKKNFHSEFRQSLHYG